MQKKSVVICYFVSLVTINLFKSTRKCCDLINCHLRNGNLTPFSVEGKHLSVLSQI